MATAEDEYNSVDAFLQDYLAQMQHEQGSAAVAAALGAHAAAAIGDVPSTGGALAGPQAMPAPPAALLHHPDSSYSGAAALATQLWAPTFQQPTLLDTPQLNPQQQEVQQMLQHQQQMYAYNSMLQQQHGYAMQQQQQHQQLKGPAAVPFAHVGGGAIAACGDAAMQDAAAAATVDVQRRGSSTGKRTSRSRKSSTTGGDSGTLHLDHSTAGGAPPLGHTVSAPPGQAPALCAAAVADAAAGNVARASSFSAGCVAPGSLTSLVHTLQQHQHQQQQQVVGRQQQQQQQGGAAEEGGEGEPDEPDMSHLTVMQRYHARRKLALQRMEREVETKLAQLAVLEDENRQLRWRAHILENMLRDMDKQLELMAASDEQPDATQWLALVGMGVGGGGGIARTLHSILEGAGRVDVSGWSAEDCRRRWLAYLKEVRPLVEEAEAAQAEHRALSSEAAGADSEAASAGMQRRPRRAAAAGADAVIKQEAAEVLGLPARLQPLRTTSSIPEPPGQPPATGLLAPAATGPPGSSSGSPSGPAAQQQDDPCAQQRAASANSDSMSHGAGGSEASCSPSVEGVPAPLLGRIEQLVLAAFHWLLAIMTTNPLLTYEFISADLLEGKMPLPPGDARHWADALERLRPTLEQMQEACTSLQVARACMAKVIEERAEIQAAMQADSAGSSDAPESSAAPDAWLSDSLIGFNTRDVLVERMRANVRKESVVRNLVGFYNINVFSTLQLAQISLASSPWFPMAWRVADACEARLNATLCAARGASRSGSGSGHNTRSSARLAAQQQRAS